MDLQTKTKLNVHFGLHQVTDKQLLKGSFVLRPRREHKLTSALRDGAKNTKLEEVFLKAMETVA